MGDRILKKEKIEKETISASIPVALKQDLWDIADRHECDLSDIIRTALYGFVKAQREREPELPME